MTIVEIHESLVNGQRRQMVDQIEEYGLYDFWKDYLDYLDEIIDPNFGEQLNFFSDAVISYHKIKNI